MTECQFDNTKFPGVRKIKQVLPRQNMCWQHLHGKQREFFMIGKLKAQSINERIITFFTNAIQHAITYTNIAIITIIPNNELRKVLLVPIPINTAITITGKRVSFLKNSLPPQLTIVYGTTNIKLQMVYIIPPIMLPMRHMSLIAWILFYRKFFQCAFRYRKQQVLAFIKAFNLRIAEV